MAPLPPPPESATGYSRSVLLNKQLWISVLSETLRFKAQLTRGGLVLGVILISLISFYLVSSNLKLKITCDVGADPALW